MSSSNTHDAKDPGPLNDWPYYPRNPDGTPDHERAGFGIQRVKLVRPLPTGERYVVTDNRLRDADTGTLIDIPVKPEHYRA